MKYNYLDHSYLTPFMQWNDLAMKTAEMMLASAQVISHRAGRMALAGHAPNESDRREFTLMGQEKMEAGAQSAQAMVTHMITMNQTFCARAFESMLQSTAAFMSLANSQTPGQLITRQAAVARALEESAIGIADVSKSATRLAHHGLKPIHAKATANAKRLAKR